MKKLFYCTLVLSAFIFTSYVQAYNNGFYQDYVAPQSPRPGFENNGKRVDYYDNTGAYQGCAETQSPRRGFEDNGGNRIDYYDNNGFHQGYGETQSPRKGFGNY